MTALNKAALLAEVDEFLADNAIGAITPEILRGIIEDVIDSTITGAGVWNSQTSYAANEFVVFDGGSYYALVDNFNKPPNTNPSIWQAVAPAGPFAAIGRTPVNDVDYEANTSDVFIGYIAITTARTVSLPAASLYPVGQPLVIADESGACSETAPINIVPAGDDTIAGQDSLTLASLYQKAVLYSNGNDLWL